MDPQLFTMKNGMKSTKEKNNPQMNFQVFHQTVLANVKKKVDNDSYFSQ